MSGIGGVVQGARLAAAAASAAETLGNVGKSISTGAAVATGVAGATTVVRSGCHISDQLRAVVEGQKGRTSTPPSVIVIMRSDSVVGKHNRIGQEGIFPTEGDPRGGVKTNVKQVGDHEKRVALDHIEGQKGAPALATGSVKDVGHEKRIALDHEKIDGDSNVGGKHDTLSGGGLLNYDTCHIGDPGCLSAGLISDFTGLGVVDHEPHGQKGRKDPCVEKECIVVGQEGVSLRVVAHEPHGDGVPVSQPVKKPKK